MSCRMNGSGRSWSSWARHFSITADHVHQVAAETDVVNQRVELRVIEHLAPAVQPFFILRPGADQVAFGEGLVAVVDGFPRGQALGRLLGPGPRPPEIEVDLRPFAVRVQGQVLVVLDLLGQFHGFLAMGLRGAPRDFVRLGFRAVSSGPCPRWLQERFLVLPALRFFFSFLYLSKASRYLSQAYAPRARACRVFPFPVRRALPGRAHRAGPSSLRPDRTILPSGSVAGQCPRKYRSTRSPKACHSFSASCQARWATWPKVPSFSRLSA